MIANAPLAIAHDPIEDPGHLSHADLEPALLGHLAPDRLARRLAQLDEPAGQAPLAGQRRLAALHEQHTPAVEHDRPHADARNAGILATVAHAGAAGHSGLA